MTAERTIEIRPLIAADKPRWQQLWAGYLAFYEARIDPAVSDITWRRLIDTSADLRGLVAIDASGGTVGIAHLVRQNSTWSPTHYLYLEDLFVDPSARGTGAGRALIEAGRQLARDDGATRYFWNTARTNETARSLYDRFTTESGFVQYRLVP